MKSFRILCALIILALLVSIAPTSAAQTDAPPVDPVAPEATPVTLDPFSTGPTYDSGWRTISQGQTLSMWHSLGLPPALMFVQLDCRRVSGVYGIHQMFMGGNDLGIKSSSLGAEDSRLGAYWHNLTTNYVSVTRQNEDTLVDAVRVRIWKMSVAADYSSNWFDILSGHNIIFTHNLGGNSGDYVVDLMFNDTDASAQSMGVNQRAYGGRTLGTKSTFFNDGQGSGAYWYGLATNVIYVHRMGGDEYADQVLVRIWKAPKRATYDSGWVPMAQGAAHGFIHNIGGNRQDYRVNLEFISNTSPMYMNQCFYGGNDIGPLATFPSTSNNDRVGAYWYALDEDSVNVTRRSEDPCADLVRIRIWNFWTPSRPDLDSGWKPVSPNTFSGLTTGITGSLDPYLVDMEFKAGILSLFGVHQYGFGGMDSNINGDRIGAYWYFTNGNLLFTRRTEDDTAPYIRARLWKMPKPDYDSGWQSFATGAYTVQLNHNLGGNPAEYLVDVQFKDSDGFTHQFGYGGYDVTHIGLGLGDRLGAFWNWLDGTHIEVRRQPEDTAIKQVRVRIWTLARPDYDSGMATTPAGISTFTHNLGGSRDDYFVNLVFNNTSGPKMLNQMYYGGAVFSANPPINHNPGDAVGGYWRGLRTTDIDFSRQPQDTWIDQARLRIWVAKQSVFLPLLRR